MLRIDTNKVSNSGKRVIMDFENLSNRVLMTNFDPLDTKFLAWKSHLFISLNYVVKMFDPCDFIMAMDKRSWRKTYYTEYKANRKARYEDGNSKIDWNKFFEVKADFIQKLKSIFVNFKWMEIDGAEADDIIGVLTRDFPQEYFLAISTDKDFHQLYRYKNFQQYNPVKSEMVQVFDPTLNLKVKIMIGDKGDNVPGIKERLGEKTAIKLLGSNEFEKLMEKKEISEAYERNKKLIDLDCTPTEIAEDIRLKYANYKCMNFERRKFVDFVMKDLPNLFNKSDEYIRNFSKINNMNSNLNQ